MKQILLLFAFFVILSAQGQNTTQQIFFYLKPSPKLHKYIHMQYWKSCDQCELLIDTAGTATSPDEALGRIIYNLTLRLDSLQSKIDSLSIMLGPPDRRRYMPTTGIRIDTTGIPEWRDVNKVRIQLPAAGINHTPAFGKKPPRKKDPRDAPLPPYAQVVGGIIINCHTNYNPYGVCLYDSLGRLIRTESGHCDSLQKNYHTIRQIINAQWKTVK